MMVTEETVTDIDPLMPKTPLERYSLDQLRLTAIVYGITDPRALVRLYGGSHTTRTSRIKRNKRPGRFVMTAEDLFDL